METLPQDPDAPQEPVRSVGVERLVLRPRLKRPKSVADTACLSSVVITGSQSVRIAKDMDKNVCTLQAPQDQGKMSPPLADFPGCGMYR